MPEWVPWLKLLKLITFAMTWTGVWTAHRGVTREQRKRACTLLFVPAYGLLWILGFLMLFARQYQEIPNWLLVSMVVSLVPLHFTFVAGLRAIEPRSPAIALTALTIALALMVLRPF